ncbi:MAG TPA: hypothetical protein VG992_04985 [Candidatus Saccharimonadales bacterium]|nr:hypothetical protein [Candidatus Saccharimonadales bacterium]
MSERITGEESFVHIQLLELARPLFFNEDGGRNGECGWFSHDNWHPALSVVSVDTHTDNPLNLAIAKAAFIMDECEFLADSTILDDYLSDDWGRELLDEFNRYFIDPKNLSLRGMSVIAQRQELAKGDLYTSKPIDADAIELTRS